MKQKRKSSPRRSRSPTKRQLSIISEASASKEKESPRFEDLHEDDDKPRKRNYKYTPRPKERYTMSPEKIAKVVKAVKDVRRRSSKSKSKSPVKK